MRLEYETHRPTTLIIFHRLLLWLTMLCQDKIERWRRH